MNKLLYLLQLASPALPIGAYSYSEGLETLVIDQIIIDKNTLENWIKTNLNSGYIRIETALMLRAYKAVQLGELNTLIKWNHWATAARESEELRQQSAQMGNSLIKLLLDLKLPLQEIATAMGKPCNYPIAFGIAAAHWEIDSQAAILGYLQSWATNLITAGVKLIPLGQTTGQKILLELQSTLINTSQDILALEDDDLSSCSWGLSLASMKHETLYSRLFRS
mgnify:CR=1 FL=1